MAPARLVLMTFPLHQTTSARLMIPHYAARPMKLLSHQLHVPCLVQMFRLARPTRLVERPLRIPRLVQMFRLVQAMFCERFED